MIYHQKLWQASFKAWLSIIGALLPPVLLIGLYYIPYLQVKSWYGLVRTAADQAYYSAHWPGFSQPYGLEAYASWILRPQKYNGEGYIYIGIIPKLLVFLGLAVLIKDFIRNPRRAKSTLALGGLGLTLALILMSLGPSDRSLGALNFWNAIAWIPGYSGIRVPGRLGFQILMFFGFTAMLFVGRWQNGSQRGISQGYAKPLWGIILIFLAGIHIYEMKPSRGPDFWVARERVAGLIQFLQQNKLSEPFLMLPIGSYVEELQVASYTNAQLVDGTSGYRPGISDRFILPNVEDCQDSKCLNLLRSLGIGLIAVDKASPQVGRVPFFRDAGGQILFEDQYFIVLRLAPAASQRFVGDDGYLDHFKMPSGQADLGFSLESKIHPEDLRLAVDSMASTRWTTGELQNENHSLTVKLDSPHPGGIIVRFEFPDDKVSASDLLCKSSLQVENSQGNRVPAEISAQLTRVEHHLAQWFTIIPKANEPLAAIKFSANQTPWCPNWWSIPEVQVKAI